MKQYYVYMMASLSKTLYVGVTNDIQRRVGEHKDGTGSRFTSLYRIDRLAHLETTPDVRAAIARERQLEGWTRARKIALIEAANPEWDDLSANWAEMPPIQREH